MTTDNKSIPESTADLIDYLRSEINSPSDVTEINSPYVAAVKSLLPTDKYKAQQAVSLIVGFEKIMNLVIVNRKILALTLSHFKQVTDATNESIASALSEVSDGVVTKSWVSRLVRAGDVLSKHPSLEGINDLESLNFLERLSDSGLKRVAETGKLGKLDVFAATRSQIVDAVNGQIKSKDQEVISAHSAKAAAVIQELVDFQSEISREDDSPFEASSFHLSMSMANLFADLYLAEGHAKIEAYVAKSERRKKVLATVEAFLPQLGSNEGLSDDVKALLEHSCLRLRQVQNSLFAQSKRG
jgi:hypothetical protein